MLRSGPAAPRAVRRPRPATPVRALQRIDDRVDLAGAPRASVPRCARRAASGTSLPGRAARARAHAASPRSPCSVSRSRASEPALVLERLHVASRPSRDARRAAPRARCGAPRPLDDRAGQAEPGRDLERQAAARRPVVQPIGRRERLGVEAEPAGDHAVGRRRIRLQRVVVRRRNHRRAARAEVIDDRHRRARRLRPDRCRRRLRRAAPAPAASSAASIATMLAMWPENVLRLAAIDCSSPMSANTDAEHRQLRCRPPPGISRPACAISASSPAVFSATVLPPVFGPVMTSTRDRRNQQDVDRHRRRSARSHVPARRSRRSLASGPRSLRTHQVTLQRRNQQRMSRGAQLEPAVGRDRRARCRRPASRSARAPAGRRARSPPRPSAPDRRRGGGTRRSARAGCDGPPPLPAARARRCRC